MTVKRQLSWYGNDKKIKELQAGDTPYYRFNIRKVATNANALDEDVIIINTDSGDKIYTLGASPDTGRRRRVINGGSNKLTIAGNGNNVLGFTDFVLKHKKSTVEIDYDGTEWV